MKEGTSVPKIPLPRKKKVGTEPTDAFIRQMRGIVKDWGLPDRLEREPDRQIE